MLRWLIEHYCIISSPLFLAHEVDLNDFQKKALAFNTLLDPLITFDILIEQTRKLFEVEICIEIYHKERLELIIFPEN